MTVYLVCLTNTKPSANITTVCSKENIQVLLGKHVQDTQTPVLQLFYAKQTWWTSWVPKLTLREGHFTTLMQMQRALLFSTATKCENSSFRSINRPNTPITSDLYRGSNCSCVKITFRLFTPMLDVYISLFLDRTLKTFGPCALAQVQVPGV